MNMRRILAMAITAPLVLGVMSCSILWPGYQYPSLGGGRKSDPPPKLNLGPCQEGTVRIGSQVWQKCNLNVDPGTGKSACYENNSENCSKYGRLYDWATAMNLPSSCNSSSCASQVSAKHRGLCPSGWHIPNDADWDKLINYVGGEKKAGKSLKVKGWNTKGNKALDSYGFSALPGGGRFSNSGDSFLNIGEGGYWWSASEYLSNYAYYRSMYYYGESVYSYYGGKSSLYSVRCLQD